MAAQNQSGKRIAISKANAQTVGVVAIATFLSIFCLVASKAVFSQNRYLSHVSAAKTKAHTQLKANIEAYEGLKTSYKAFDERTLNVINGNRGGTGDNDGSNSKIILDALPNTYDFPALTASIEKIMTGNGLKVSDITGIDDQLNQQTNTSSPNPQPVEIPFSFTIDGADYAAVQKLFTALQHSIRPIHIDDLQVSGGQKDLTVSVKAHTFFQPSKSLSITMQEVK